MSLYREKDLLIEWDWEKIKHLLLESFYMKNKIKSINYLDFKPLILLGVLLKKVY